MNILIVSASNRPESQSRKVATRVQEKLAKLNVGADVLDLHTAHLPLFEGEVNTAVDHIRTQLQQADAYVWVVPEWDGMVPPAMMNLISHAGTTLAHKPVLLVTVSSGAGGSYPMAELKAFGSKNTHYVLVPEQVIVREVEKVLDNEEPESENKVDTYIHTRLTYSLTILLAYTDALAGIRSNTELDLEVYRYGM